MRQRVALWWQWRRITAHTKQRERVRAADPELFDAVSAVLFKHDPMGINFEDNTDEYDFEVGTILPRLPDARSPDDVARIVREEFHRWFEGVSIGSPERYEPIGREVWELFTSGSRRSEPPRPAG